LIHAMNRPACISTRLNRRQIPLDWFPKIGKKKFEIR
jgi:hypothetical protein